MTQIKRTWSIDEKESILNDIEKTGVVEGCRKHGIYATTYYSWLAKYRESGKDGLAGLAQKRADRDAKKLQQENDRLKKLLAEKELELAIKDELLKKKMQQWRSENRSSTGLSKKA
jgi:putative transposase